MRVAIIDLGTNTFNLLIADTDATGEYTIVHNEKMPVRLGEGGINEGIIAEAAFVRGVQAIVAYQKVLQQFDATHILAFATSAVRNASNGEVFKKAVLDATGISIHIISGGEEAEYICDGVRESLQLHQENSLIIDIGGGSLFWSTKIKFTGSTVLKLEQRA
jgi:exopolyphosphatase / guanosine-5'-triphosphate,3'-diphosphate pyrophosphatase